MPTARGSFGNVRLETGSMIDGDAVFEVVAVADVDLIYSTR